MGMLAQEVIIGAIGILILLVRMVETKFGQLESAYGKYGFGNETELPDLQCLKSFDNIRSDVCPVNTWNMSTSESTSVEAECIWVIAVWLMLKFF